MSLKYITFLLFIKMSTTYVNSQNMILNSSFEDNKATHISCNSWLALTETNYDSVIDNSSAIYFNNHPNLTHGIDLVDSNCAFPGGDENYPQDKEWYLTLNSWNYGDSIIGKEGITMELSSEMNLGSNYMLRFYSYTLSDPPFSNILKIGLSNSSNGFGTQVYEIIPDTTNWQLFEFEFTPDSNYSYLSVWVEENGYGHGLTGIDNFILTKNTTGVNEFKNKNISIYPNPFKDNISVETVKNGIVKIVDIYGKEVFNQKIQKGKNNISLNNISSGIYIIDINGFKQKIIKN